MGITRTKIAAGLLAPILVWTLTGPVQAAELQGFAELCADKPQICFWHKAIVAPPKGWVEDPHWTKRYKAMTMFENGDQSASKPTMYLRTHPGATEISLDDYIRGAQEGWRKVVTDTSIEPLPDFERPGKPTIFST